MREIQTPAKRRGVPIAGLALVLTVCAAVALLAIPNATERLTSIPPAPQVSAPDELPAAAKDDPTAFLLERDLIELRVPADTTLAEFLQRNRLNKPAQRKQVAEQIGSNDPNAKIAAGKLLRIRLTPSASDVPGTSRTGGGR
jgi:hypothetical protein